jgi:hypothetical protein
MTILAKTILMTALIGCTADKESMDTSTTQDTQSEITSTIWSGSKVTFTKEDSADHTDPANQDAITDLVILTRPAQGSLINVVVDDSATSTTPSGTEWAMGTTAEIDTLEFEPLKSAANNRLKDIPDIPLVLHLIEEDIYIDVTFLDWSFGANSGGGFRYERSTP